MAATRLVVSVAAPVLTLDGTPTGGGVCWLDGSLRVSADYAVAHRHTTIGLEARVQDDVTSAAAPAGFGDLGAAGLAFDPALPPKELFGGWASC